MRERATAVFDFENRQAGLVDGEMVEGGRRVSDDAECAGGDGLVDVFVAVCRTAFHGDKDGAGADAAGVVFDASDGGVGAAGCAFGGDFGGEFLPIHVEVHCRWRGDKAEFAELAALRACWRS